MKLPFSLVVICFLSFYHSLAHGNQPKKPLVVFLCAEQEYETARTLPDFSRRYLASYQTVFSFATEQDPNVLSLHEPIQRADLLIVSVRRRALPDEQLEFIKQYVAAQLLESEPQVTRFLCVAASHPLVIMSGPSSIRWSLVGITQIIMRMIF